MRCPRGVLHLSLPLQFYHEILYDGNHNFEPKKYFRREETFRISALLSRRYDSSLSPCRSAKYKRTILKLQPIPIPRFSLPALKEGGGGMGEEAEKQATTLFKQVQG